MIKQLV